MIYCCKGCVPPKRYPGCHDRCPEYLEEKKKNDQIRDQKYKENAIEAGLFDHNRRFLKRLYKRHKRPF